MWTSKIEALIAGRPAMLWIACGAVLAAIACAIALAICKRRGRRKDKNPGPTQKAESGIPIRLEVYAGRCRNKTAFLELHHCLTIGSAADCDIVFDDPEVAPQHSRIRLDGSQVYIEDLGSPQGTALDGMRIQGRNRLRDGETISIGPVEFSLSYPCPEQDD